MTIRTINIILVGIVSYSCSFFQSNEGYFEVVTELEIIEPIEIISEGSESYDMDGTSWLVFKTSDKQISKWISAPPPWSNKSWQRGLVDYQIGFHSSFGAKYGKVSYVGGGDTTYYSGDERLIEVLTDTNNYFAYQERCCQERGEELRFHNGSLLIINPKTNLVYLSVWDW